MASPQADGQASMDDIVVEDDDLFNVMMEWMRAAAQIPDGVSGLQKTVRDSREKIRDSLQLSNSESQRFRIVKSSERRNDGEPLAFFVRVNPPGEPYNLPESTRQPKHRLTMTPHMGE